MIKKRRIGMEGASSDRWSNGTEIEWEIESVFHGAVVLSASTLGDDENKFMDGIRDGILILDGLGCSLRSSKIGTMSIEGERMESRVDLIFELNLIWDDVVDMLREGGLT